MAKSTVTLEEVTIRFAGDSGDGMQLTGTQFTNTAAVFGNDLSTLPDRRVISNLSCIVNGDAAARCCLRPWRSLPSF